MSEPELAPAWAAPSASFSQTISGGFGSLESQLAFFFRPRPNHLGKVFISSVCCNLAEPQSLKGHLGHLLQSTKGFKVTDDTNFQKVKKVEHRRKAATKGLEERNVRLFPKGSGKMTTAQIILG